MASAVLHRSVANTLNTMEISPRLVPVLWGALGVAGAAAIVFMLCLNVLLGAHRPAALRGMWISGALLFASLTAVVLILAH
jgi:hypothetical protein